MSCLGWQWLYTILGEMVNLPKTEPFGHTFWPVDFLMLTICPCIPCFFINLRMRGEIGYLSGIWWFKFNRLIMYVNCWKVNFTVRTHPFSSHGLYRSVIFVHDSWPHACFTPIGVRDWVSAFKAHAPLLTSTPLFYFSFMKFLNYLSPRIAH